MFTEMIKIYANPPTKGAKASAQRMLKAFAEGAPVYKRPSLVPGKRTFTESVDRRTVYGGGKGGKLTYGGTSKVMSATDKALLGEKNVKTRAKSTASPKLTGTMPVDMTQVKSSLNYFKNVLGNKAYPLTTVQRTAVKSAVRKLKSMSTRAENIPQQRG